MSDEDRPNHNGGWPSQTLFGTDINEEVIMLVSQGHNPDCVEIRTLRLSPRRCVRAAFETSVSHVRLRRTQEPEEHTTVRRVA